MNWFTTNSTPSHSIDFASLEIIMGPMSCGKTTELIRRLTVAADIELKVLYINHACDTRSTQSQENVFSTHNSILNTLDFGSSNIKQIKLSSLDNIEMYITEFDVIGIDEIQFFSDIRTACETIVDRFGKKLIVSGLSGDFKRNKFGELTELIPLADSINFISAYCEYCKQDGILKPAIFTHRKINNDETVLVGGKESYSPVCRKCYLNKVN